MKPEAHAAKGYGLALASSGVLSTTALFIRHLSVAYGMPSLALCFWRAGLAAGLLLGGMALLKPGLLRVPLRDLGFLGGYGLVLALFNVLWTLAVARTGAALATVLVNGSAAFTVILGWLLLREGMDARRLCATTLGLIGCLLVVQLERGRAESSFLGWMAGLASALLYAAYSLMGRVAAQRRLNSMTTVGFTFSFAWVFLALLLGVLQVFSLTQADLLHLGIQAKGWFWLVLLAWGPTVLGFLLYNQSLVHLPSGIASLIMGTEPVFTALAAMACLGECMSGRQWMGCGFILAGIVWLRLGEMRSVSTLLRPHHQAHRKAHVGGVFVVGDVVDVAEAQGAAVAQADVHAQIMDQ